MNGAQLAAATDRVGISVAKKSTREISFLLSFVLDGEDGDSCQRKKYVFFWKVFVSNLSLIILDFSFFR